MKKRVDFCYKYTLDKNKPIENDNDPIYKLIFNYEDIEAINKNNENDKIFQFFYFNRKVIHQIFYDTEIIWPVKSVDKINLSELFFLNLLILDNSETINYSFSIDYIEFIHSENKNKKKSFEQMILSKIILSFIFNFKGEEEYDENEFEEKIDIIEKENKEIIKNNLDLFKDLNLKYNYDNFCEAKIDYIYMEIITALIKEKKYEDFQYCEDLLIELDMKRINITKTIFDGISELLEKTLFKKPEFNLENIEPQINFFNILIKFIFKNSFYPYRIKFFMKNIMNFCKYITTKINNMHFSDNIYEKRMEEISDILFAKYSKLFKNNDSNQIIQNSIAKFTYSIHQYFSKARKDNDDGKLFENSFEMAKNQKDEETDISKIKIEYNKAVKILEKLRLTISISPNKNEENPEKQENQEQENPTEFKYKEIIYGNDGDKLENIDDLKFNADYEYISEKDKTYKDAEKVYKNYKKLLNFIEDIRDCIKKAKIKFNPQITLEISKDSIYYVQSNEFKDLDYLTCLYTFKNQINDETMTFKDENILVFSINGKSQGFNNLINELTNEDYDGENFKYDD